MFLDNSGPILTCYEYKIKIDHITECVLQRYATDRTERGRTIMAEDQDQIVRRAFDYFSSESGLIGSTILYPDDHRSITTQQYLEIDEPYRGTYTGYYLESLVLNRMPLFPHSFKNSYDIVPIYTKTPRLRNYKTQDPDYGVVSLAWEHYTLRHT